MEASRTNFEFEARSANVPPDPSPESTVSTAPLHEVRMTEMHDTAFHVQIADGGLTQSHSFAAMVSLRTDFGFSFFISSARHHVHHPSCQCSNACTARAVHHKVAQITVRPLPPSLELEPPVIAHPSTELASTPVNHDVFRLRRNGQDAQDGSEMGSTEERSDIQPDVSASQSRGDRSAPRLRAPIAHSLVQSQLVFQFNSGAGPSAPQGFAELQREQALRRTLCHTLSKWLLPHLPQQSQFNVFH